MNAPKTIAEQISDALEGDGQQWRTRPTDDSKPQTLDDLVRLHGGADIDWRDGFRSGDVYRLTFADGSAITVAGSAWDFGFADCFCWQGCPNDDCTSDHA